MGIRMQRVTHTSPFLQIFSFFSLFLFPFPTIVGRFFFKGRAQLHFRFSFQMPQRPKEKLGPPAKRFEMATRKVGGKGKNSSKPALLPLSFHPTPPSLRCNFPNVRVDHVSASTFFFLICTLFLFARPRRNHPRLALPGGRQVIRYGNLTKVLLCLRSLKVG